MRCACRCANSRRPPVECCSQEIGAHTPPASERSWQHTPRGIAVPAAHYPGDPGYDAHRRGNVVPSYAGHRPGDAERFGKAKAFIPPGTVDTRVDPNQGRDRALTPGHGSAMCRTTTAFLESESGVRVDADRVRESSGINQSNTYLRTVGGVVPGYAGHVPHSATHVGTEHTVARTLHCCTRALSTAACVYSSHSAHSPLLHMHASHCTLFTASVHSSHCRGCTVGYRHVGKPHVGGVTAAMGKLDARTPARAAAAQHGHSRSKLDYYAKERAAIDPGARACRSAHTRHTQYTPRSLGTHSTRLFHGTHSARLVLSAHTVHTPLHCTHSARLSNWRSTALFSLEDSAR
jgi:hypothetical protein